MYVKPTPPPVGAVHLPSSRVLPPPSPGGLPPPASPRTLPPQSPGVLPPPSPRTLPPPSPGVIPPSPRTLPPPSPGVLPPPSPVNLPRASPVPGISTGIPIPAGYAPPGTTRPLDLTVHRQETSQGTDQPLDLTTKPSSKRRGSSEEDDVIVLGVHKPAKCVRAHEGHTHVTSHASHARSGLVTHAQSGGYMYHHQQQLTQQQQQLTQQQRLLNNNNLPNFALINKNLVGNSNRHSAVSGQSSSRAQLYQAIIQQQQQQQHHLNLKQQQLLLQQQQQQKHQTQQQRGVTSTAHPQATSAQVSVHRSTSLHGSSHHNGPTTNLPAASPHHYPSHNMAQYPRMPTPIQGHYQKQHQQQQHHNQQHSPAGQATSGSSAHARGGSHHPPPYTQRTSIINPIVGNTTQQQRHHPHQDHHHQHQTHQHHPQRVSYSYNYTHSVQPPPYPGHPPLQSYSNSSLKQGPVSPAIGRSQQGKDVIVTSQGHSDHSASTHPRESRSPRHLVGNMAISRVQENLKAFSSSVQGYKPSTTSSTPSSTTTSSLTTSSSSRPPPPHHYSAIPPCPTGGGSISLGVPIIGPLPPQYGIKSAQTWNPPGKSQEPCCRPGSGQDSSGSTRSSGQNDSVSKPMKQEGMLQACTLASCQQRSDTKPRYAFPHYSVSGPMIVPPPAKISSSEAGAHKITIQSRPVGSSAGTLALPSGIRLVTNEPMVAGGGSESSTVTKTDRYYQNPPLGQNFKKIPVANVNPIIHNSSFKGHQNSSLYGMHPKKQLLYQSQMETQTGGCGRPGSEEEGESGRCSKVSNLRSMLEGKEYVRETLPLHPPPPQDQNKLEGASDSTKPTFILERVQPPKELEQHLKEDHHRPSLAVEPIAKVPQFMTNSGKGEEDRSLIDVPQRKAQKKPDIMQPLREKLKQKCAQRQAMQEAVCSKPLSENEKEKDGKVRPDSPRRKLGSKPDTSPNKHNATNKRGPERKKKGMAPLSWKVMQAYRHDRGLQSYRHCNNRLLSSPASSSISSPAKSETESSCSSQKRGPNSPSAGVADTRSDHHSIYDFDSSPTVCLTDISKIHRKAAKLVRPTKDYFDDSDATETEDSAEASPSPKKTSTRGRGKERGRPKVKDRSDDEKTIDSPQQISEDSCDSLGRGRKVNKKGVPVRRYRRRHKATGWDYERQNARKRQQYLEARQNQNKTRRSHNTGNVKTRTRATTRGNRRTGTYNKNAAYERELRRDEYRKLLLRYKREARPLPARITLSRRASNRVATRAHTRAHQQKIQQQQQLKRLQQQRKLQQAATDGKTGPSPSGDGQNEAGAAGEGKQVRRRRFGPTKASLTKALHKHRRQGGKLPKHVPRPRLHRPIKPYEADYGIREHDVNVHTQVIPDSEVTGYEAEVVTPPPDVKRLVVLKETGETMLHKAARKANVEVALYCLRTKCVEVNARDHAGYTPLHEACVRGHMTIVKHLIGCGADVNAAAHDGTRPIHDAVDNSHIEVVRLLLSCGADMNLATYSGRTCARLAKTPDMKAFLINYQADLNGPTDSQVPWEFDVPGHEQDSDRLGQDIFADVPGSEGTEETMLFDISDEELLPAYHLTLNQNKGPRNYHVLSDVIERLRVSKDTLIGQLESPEIHTIPFTEFHHQVACSQLSCTRNKPLPSGPEVEVILLTDVLNELLGVQTELVNMEEDEMKEVKEEERKEEDDDKEVEGVMGGDDCDSGLGTDDPPTPRYRHKRSCRPSSAQGTSDGRASASLSLDRSSTASSSSSFSFLFSGSSSEDCRMTPDVEDPVTSMPVVTNNCSVILVQSDLKKVPGLGQTKGLGRTTNQQMHKVFQSQEFKVGTTPEDCFMELARKHAERRRSACDDRSISPKAAQPAETLHLPRKEGSMVQHQPEGEPFDSLPVLEKHAKGEDSDGTDMNEEVVEDREMPKLTIAAY